MTDTTPHSNASQTHNDRALTLTVLSDNSTDGTLIQYLLSLKPNANVQCDIVTATQYSTTQLINNSIIIIDRDFRSQPFLRTTIEIFDTFKSLDKPLPSLYVLVEEQFLEADLASFAPAAKAGVQSFLLKSELSLKLLMKLMDASVQFSKNNHSAPQLFTQGSSISNDHLIPTTANTNTTNNLASGAEPTALNNALDSKPADTVVHSHQLTIDLANQRAHISQNGASVLAEHGDSVLSIDQCLNMLDENGSTAFTEMLTKAAQFQAIPKTISCQLNRQFNRPEEDFSYPICIDEIQIKENGQGRVIGASAQLSITHPESNIESLITDEQYTDTGFDNLFDNSVLNRIENDWMHVVQSLPVVCLVLDDAGNIVRHISGDPASTQDFPKPVVGQNLANYLGSDNQESLVQVISKTLNTGKANQQTVTLQSERGLRWLETHTTKLKGNLGLTRQVVWTAFDVTPSRQAYQELLKNHDALTDTINDAPVLFSQKDIEGRYQRVNRAFCETFRVRADLVAGRSDAEVFDTNMAAAMTREDRESIDAGAEIDFNQVVDFDGESIQLHWHKFAIKGHSGRIESIAAFAFIMEELAYPKKQNTEVHTPENTVIQNVTQNENNPIDQALLGSPSGAVGQDFKMMVSSIVGYTEMALSQRNASRAQRFISHLNQVVDTSMRARELIIESSNQNSDSAHREETDLKPLVNDIVSMLQPTLPTSLDFQLDIDNAKGKALVSPTRFQRLVMQLITSARDTAKPQNKTELNTPPNVLPEKDKILLSLNNRHYKQRSCAACDHDLEGHFIALSVTTSTESIDNDALEKLMRAIKATSTHQEAETDKKNNNVIIMAHNCDAHILIEHQHDNLILQFVFPQLPDNIDDPNSPKKPKSESKITALSSL